MRVERGNPASIRICIPIEQKPLGGMYTFLENWKRWLRQNDISQTEDAAADYNVLFVNSFAVSYALIAAEKRARPDLLVVQRVDGSARDYGRMDDSDDRQARVNMLADLTIFQSIYSKFSTTRKMKVIRQHGPVIYNPVDIHVFHAVPTRSFPGERPKICNVSHSENVRKGTWLIGVLAKENPDLDFILCGNYPLLPDLPNIILRGRLDRAELARTMRSCNVFLHLAENDPCPNVVLEALASGLPVLYRDSGGTPELVGQCGRTVTLENFRSELESALRDHKSLSAAARERAVSYFAPDRIFPSYIDAITRAERRPSPSARDFLRAAINGYPVLPWRPGSLYWRIKRSVRGLLAVP